VGDPEILVVVLSILVVTYECQDLSK
jgi:hypothetical protein